MYIGPETIMPLASVVAAITGAVLMFWRKVVALFRSAGQAVSRTLLRGR